VAVADYPAAVRNRSPATGGGVSGAVAVSVPRVRMWPFLCRPAVGTAAWAGSTRFQGPAVILDMVLSTVLTTGVLPNPTLSLWKCASDPGNVIGQAVTAAPPGVKISDELSRADSTADTLRNHVWWPGWGGFNRLEPLPVRLGIPVLDPEFFLAALVIADGAAFKTAVGFIRVVEGLAPEEVANFL
jgi:hypothetical protein